jgi:septum formation protein
MKDDQKIILATASPYRKRAFENLGIDFEICASDINENFKNRPKDPKKLVLELAKIKCEVVANKYRRGFVIGFDSVAYCNKKILEKPRNIKEAKKRILSMSGKRFNFYTGVYLKNAETGKISQKVVETKGKMRKVSEKEIDFYHRQDKKGIGYAIGFDVKYNFASTFVKEIKGSYLNFLDGIPLEAILEMLYKLGYKL